jgi:hypothetical protein
MTAREDKPSEKKNKNRPGWLRHYWAWFMAVMGADPGYRPWEGMPEEDEGPKEKKD